MSIHTPQGSLWLGAGFALFSAISFSLNVVLAGMSYQHGANVHTLNLIRAALFLACLVVVVGLSSNRASLPPKARLPCIWLGVLLCAEMYAILLAIRTIPVALAVLVFYTYPIIIAVAGWILGRERFRPFTLVFLGAAFLGLVIVLADGDLAPDIQGTAYAVAAAVIMAAMLITSESSLKNYDNFVVLLYALTTVTAIIAAISFTLVPLEWPSGRTGWVVFSASSIFYVMATFTLFKAVALAGPLRTAIIDNTSPVWATIFAFFLLDQVMSDKQLIGMVIVVSAVIALQATSRSTTEGVH